MAGWRYDVDRGWERPVQHCHAGRDVAPRFKCRSVGVVMKVYVDDIDKHFSRAKAEGAKLISEPQDGFWGGRIYRALDHEGYHWEISQRGRDLAAERWQLPPGVTRGVPK